MARSRGKRFWEKLAREVAGGGGLEAVAKRHGVSGGWLGKWCRRLRDEAPSSSLLPVRIVESRARRVDLTVGAARLSFDEGTDPDYIARVARALAQ